MKYKKGVVIFIRNTFYIVHSVSPGGKHIRVSKDGQKWTYTIGIKSKLLKLANKQEAATYILHRLTGE